MSYIGRQPQIGNFQICDAISTVNNQAAYTMQVGSVNVLPETANHMIVSLNGVIQAPISSFTVSGSTITFAANLVTGDVINFIQILGDVLDLGVPSDGTVTTAKLATNAVTTVKITDANVTTAKVADNAINLAKMASGTDGNIISYDTSGNPVAVATGSSGEVLTSAGAGAVPTFAALPSGGLSGADFWRLNADVKFGTGIQILDSNWERVDSDNYGVIGSAMSQSSGVFTFPTTGIWLIQHQVSIFATDGEIQRHDSRIQTTTNNASYDDAAFSHMSTDAANYRQSTTFSFIVDCQNTSTNKLRFTYNDVDDNDPTLVGASNATCTGAFFIKLGNT